MHEEWNADLEECETREKETIRVVSDPRKLLENILTTIVQFASCGCVYFAIYFEILAKKSNHGHQSLTTIYT